MSGLFDGLRSGAWVSRERMRFVALAVTAAFTIGLGYVIATAHGGVDFQGRPVGTDFSNVFAAGSYVLDGHPDLAFDPALQHAREQAIFGSDTPAYGWHYPPFFLFVAAALALMPYGLALAVWQGSDPGAVPAVDSSRANPTWPLSRPAAATAAVSRSPARCGSCSPSDFRPSS